MFVPEGNAFFVPKGNLIYMCTFQLFQNVVRMSFSTTATATARAPSIEEALKRIPALM
jgi:hypothetical protein